MSQQLPAARADVRYLQVRDRVLSNLDGGDIANQLGGERNRQIFIAAATAAIEGDEKIMACDPSSIVRALYTCVSMGALPASSVTPQTQREVALIPRNKVLTVIAEWRYFKRQFERHPDVADARAYIVHTMDQCEWDADTERFSHTYDPFDPNRTWPDSGATVKGAYLRLRFRESAGGGFRDFPVTKEHILHARAAGGPVWKGPWFVDMVLKTVYRKAASSEVITFDPMSDVGRQIGAALRADVVDAEDSRKGRMGAITGATSPAAMIAPFPARTIEHEPAHDAETGEVTGEMSEDEAADIRAQEFALAGGDA